MLDTVIQPPQLEAEINRDFRCFRNNKTVNESNRQLSDLSTRDYLDFLKFRRRGSK